MTTYTLTGSIVVSNNSGGFSYAGPIELVIVAPDAQDSFSYSILNDHPDSLPDVTLNGFQPYTMEATWEYGDPIQMEALLENISIGFLDWGTDSSAEFLAFYPGSSAIISQLSGDPTPELLTPDDADAWVEEFGDMGVISSGPFAPGMEIGLDNLPGVTVSEHDTIIGDGLMNVYHGGVGRDVIKGKAGHDRLYGDAGDDRLFGDNGNDRLFGGGQNDRLYGQAGNDRLAGDNGNDKLVGGGGNDILVGGKGDDRLIGGLGADRFVFSAVANLGNDTIADFQDGIDMIAIAGSTSFGDLSITQIGADTLVSWLSTSVTLTSINVSDVTSADFDFV